MDLDRCGTLMTLMSRFTRLKASCDKGCSLSVRFCSVTTQTPIKPITPKIMAEWKSPIENTSRPKKGKISLDYAIIELREIVSNSEDGAFCILAYA